MITSHTPAPTLRPLLPLPDPPPPRPQIPAALIEAETGFRGSDGLLLNRYGYAPLSLEWDLWLDPSAPSELQGANVDHGSALHLVQQVGFSKQLGLVQLVGFRKQLCCSCLHSLQLRSGQRCWQGANVD